MIEINNTVKVFRTGSRDSIELLASFSGKGGGVVELRSRELGLRKKSTR